MRASALDQRDRQLIERLARQQTAAGVAPRQAVANARTMLYGHLQTIDERDFAHVYFPATEDADTFRRGLQILRLEAALAVLQAQEPQWEGKEARGDAVAIQRWRHLDRAFSLQSKGVWINDGSGFALVAPETGEPVALRDRVLHVTVDEVLRAGSRVQGTDRELQSRFDDEYGKRRKALERQNVRQPPADAPAPEPVQPMLAP
jgi:hypothetical protein